MDGEGIADVDVESSSGHVDGLENVNVSVNVYSQDASPPAAKAVGTLAARPWRWTYYVSHFHYHPHAPTKAATSVPPSPPLATTKSKMIPSVAVVVAPTKKKNYHSQRGDASHSPPGKDTISCPSPHSET